MIAVVLGIIAMSLLSWIAARMSRKGRGISIIIPFRCADPANPRVRNLEWLKRYWAAQLPAAKIIMGVDPDLDKPFSKSVAINNAVKKAKGDVFFIVDADGYMPAADVLHCAKEIRRARKRGHKLWFVPYRQFYRLTEEASAKLLASDPANPVVFPVPPAKDTVIATDHKVGHWYGAMVQIVPREAFDVTGGWDERFRGWGGEDYAAMRAIDTLYSLHKTLPGAVFHVWHPQLSTTGQGDFIHWKDRVWEGQHAARVNSELSLQYFRANGDPVAMRKLISGVRIPAKKSPSIFRESA